MKEEESNIDAKALFRFLALIAAAKEEYEKIHKDIIRLETVQTEQVYDCLIEASVMRHMNDHKKQEKEDRRLKREMKSSINETRKNHCEFMRLLSKFDSYVEKGGDLTSVKELMVKIKNVLN